MDLSSLKPSKSDQVGL